MLSCQLSMTEISSILPLKAMALVAKPFDRHEFKVVNGLGTEGDPVPVEGKGASTVRNQQVVVPFPNQWRRVESVQLASTPWVLRKLNPKAGELLSQM